MIRSPIVALLTVTLAGCAQWIRQASDAERPAAIEAARAARVDGPAEVRLDGGAVLLLQAGLSYVPPAEGGRLLRAIGGRERERLLGVVVAAADQDSKVAALYAGTSRFDKIPEVEVVGWSHAPALRVSAVSASRAVPSP